MTTDVDNEFNNFMMSAIFWFVLGLASIVYGILILTKVVKTHDGDLTSRLYAASECFLAGIAGIVLGIAIYYSN